MFGLVENCIVTAGKKDIAIMCPVERIFHSLHKKHQIGKVH